VGNPGIHPDRIGKLMVLANILPGWVQDTHFEMRKGA
jgi:hypothetical protein